jgi:hypothetical protein
MFNRNKSQKKLTGEDVDEPRNLLNSYAVLLPRKVGKYGEKDENSKMTFYRDMHLTEVC